MASLLQSIKRRYEEDQAEAVAQYEKQQQVQLGVAETKDLPNGHENHLPRVLASGGSTTTIAAPEAHLSSSELPAPQQQPQPHHQHHRRKVATLRRNGRIVMRSEEAALAEATIKAQEEAHFSPDTAASSFSPKGFFGLLMSSIFSETKIHNNANNKPSVTAEEVADDLNVQLGLASSSPSASSPLGQSSYPSAVVRGKRRRVLVIDREMPLPVEKPAETEEEKGEEHTVEHGNSSNTTYGGPVIASKKVEEALASLKAETNPGANPPPNDPFSTSIRRKMVLASQGVPVRDSLVPGLHRHQEEPGLVASTNTNTSRRSSGGGGGGSGANALAFTSGSVLRSQLVHTSAAMPSINKSISISGWGHQRSAVGSGGGGGGAAVSTAAELLSAFPVGDGNIVRVGRSGQLMNPSGGRGEELVQERSSRGRSSGKYWARKLSDARERSAATSSNHPTQPRFALSRLPIWLLQQSFGGAGAATERAVYTAYGMGISLLVGVPLLAVFAGLLSLLQMEAEAAAADHEEGDGAEQCTSAAIQLLHVAIADDDRMRNRSPFWIGAGGAALGCCCLVAVPYLVEKGNFARTAMKDQIQQSGLGNATRGGGKRRAGNVPRSLSVAPKVRQSVMLSLFCLTSGMSVLVIMQTIQTQQQQPHQHHHPHNAPVQLDPASNTKDHHPHPSSAPLSQGSLQRCYLSWKLGVSAEEIEASLQRVEQMMGPVTQQPQQRLGGGGGGGGSKMQYNGRCGSPSESGSEFAARDRLDLKVWSEMTTGLVSSWLSKIV